LIASGSGDRSVRLWDIETNQQVLQLVIDDGVTTVAISPDNRYVAAGSLDKSVRVWDTSTGFLVERLEGEFGHMDSVYSVAFAPNGKDLVSGSLDKTIKMWELATPTQRTMAGQGQRGGKCIKTFEGHKVRDLSSNLWHNEAPLTLRCRTLFSALLSLLTDSGCSVDPRIEAFNSGTPSVVQLN